MKLTDENIKKMNQIDTLVLELEQYQLKITQLERDAVLSLHLLPFIIVDDPKTESWHTFDVIELRI